MNGTKKPVGQVYMTTDYSCFKRLEANRTVEVDRIERIKESIGTHYVPAPIIVNEKMEVIDGQGRLAALEELGKPVYFYEIPGLTIRECALMNIASSKWSNYDLIKMYADTGSLDYGRVFLLMTEFQHKSSRIVTEAAKRNENIGVKDLDKLFRKQEDGGGFTFSESDYLMAREVLLKAYELYGIVDRMSQNKKGKKDLIARACIQCIKAKGYDHKKMKEAFENNAHKFSTGASKREMIEMFARWYNKGKRMNFMDVYSSNGTRRSKTIVTFEAQENRWRM